MTSTSLRYMIWFSLDGPVVQTYCIVKEPQAGPLTCNPIGPPSPVFREAQGALELRTDAAVEFECINGFEAQTQMLDLGTLSRIFQTWPWSPASAEAHRDAEIAFGRAVEDFKYRGLLDVARSSQECMELVSTQTCRHIEMSYSVTVSDLEAVAASNALTGITLIGRTIRDTHVELISGLRGLQYLSLAGTGIGDNSGAILKHFRNLRVLDASRTCVTDRFVAESGQFCRVGILRMSETLVSDLLIDCTDGMNGPVVVDVSRTEITDRLFLDHVGTWKPIIELNISQTMVTDKSVEYFAQCGNLRSLRLDFCDVTWNGIRELRGHPVISELSLRGVSISSSQYFELRESLPQCLVTM